MHMPKSNVELHRVTKMVAHYDGFMHDLVHLLNLHPTRTRSVYIYGFPN